MIRDFLRWWVRQMTDVLPLAALQRLVDGGRAGILEFDGSHVSLMSASGGAAPASAHVKLDDAGLARLLATAQLPGKRRHVVLRPQRGVALQKRLAVPLAARHHLEQVLRFELDRETPFALDEVYWDYAVRHKNQTKGQIEVDLAVAPRASVDPVLQAMRRAGFEPIGVEAGEGANAQVIRLERRRQWSDWRSERSLVFAAAAAGVLALAVVTVPFLRQQQALASIDAMIEASMPSAKEAAALRQTADRLNGAAGYLQRELDRSGSALAALAAVTRALPDDTHLTALSLRQGRLTMIGVAPSAAGLVRHLAQVPDVQDPVFDSPVMSGESGGLESFTISVSLKPAGRS